MKPQARRDPQFGDRSGVGGGGKENATAMCVYIYIYILVEGNDFNGHAIKNIYICVCNKYIYLVNIYI